MRQDTYYLLYITEYGDDWEDTSKIVYLNEKDRSAAIEGHKVSIRGVHGIRGADYDREDVTENDLRYRLTVDEYCDLFPEVTALLNQLHKG